MTADYSWLLRGLRKNYCQSIESKSLLLSLPAFSDQLYLTFDFDQIWRCPWTRFKRNSDQTTKQIWQETDQPWQLTSLRLRILFAMKHNPDSDPDLDRSSVISADLILLTLTWIYLTVLTFQSHPNQLFAMSLRGLKNIAWIVTERSDYLSKRYSCRWSTCFSQSVCVRLVRGNLNLVRPRTII